MHEYSIVSSLIESCEEYARQNCATIVTKVVVKIGVLSGVEPHLLKEAFEAFKTASLCADAKLVINIQKVKISCKSCQNEQEIEKNEFVCPKCGSFDVDVLEGEDMYLMSLELE